MLVNQMPTKLSEWHSQIPLKLREAINSDEMIFMEDVFEIIEDYY